MATLDQQEHSQNGKIDYAVSKQAAMILRSVNQPQRQQILKLLEEQKTLKVTDIYVKLRLEQSVASQHLRILRLANVVTDQRSGKEIHYSLNIPRIEEITTFINKMVE